MRKACNEPQILATFSRYAYLAGFRQARGWSAVLSWRTWM